MTILNELIEIMFYLSITLIIETLVLLGLGYFNKRFLIILVLLNLVTNPIYSGLLAIYSNVFDNEMGILLILLLEIIIISVEFFVIFKYLKEKYSKIELLITVILVNGFSFLIIEFIKYAFEYVKVFPLI